MSTEHTELVDQINAFQTEARYDDMDVEESNWCRQNFCRTNAHWSRRVGTMVDPEVINIVRRYLAALPAIGIHPSHAAIFGSHVRGETHEWSDIDLLVVAPEFDNPRPIPVKSAARLWAVARQIDVRIEPLPCGTAEWKQPHIRQIVDVAAREGMEIAA